MRLNEGSEVWVHLKEGSKVWVRTELKVSVVPSWWSVAVVRQAPSRF